MIVIIDYRMGNIGSILNMLKRIGAPDIISSDPAEIRKADRLTPSCAGSGAAETNVVSDGQTLIHCVLDARDAQDLLVLANRADPPQGSSRLRMAGSMKAAWVAP
jgi:imidazole glycerol-phosphate synthase subunit HisH